MTNPDILGRQPNPCFITPSNPNPWYGTIVAGRTLTAQQEAALNKAGVDPAVCECILVTRNATHREAWWPKTSPAPQFQFPCPIVSRRRDGRINIISPSGLPAIVDADGFAGRTPSPKKGRGA